MHLCTVESNFLILFENVQVCTVVLNAPQHFSFRQCYRRRILSRIGYNSAHLIFFKEIRKLGSTSAQMQNLYWGLYGVVYLCIEKELLDKHVELKRQMPSNEKKFCHILNYFRYISFISKT